MRRELGVCRPPAATPFEWKFTRADLAAHMKRLAEKQASPNAA